jgi:hypothetical protein
MRCDHHFFFAVRTAYRDGMSSLALSIGVKAAIFSAIPQRKTGPRGLRYSPVC